MGTQSTVPNLTLSQNARLYKYVRLPNGWKYLRADYSDSFGVKPHSVFLPKTKNPTIVEGGNYVASDGGKWYPHGQDGDVSQEETGAVHGTTNCGGAIRKLLG
jgi:hypothetical protein